LPSRKANLSSVATKNFRLAMSGKSTPLVSAVPRFSRGALRGRHERWARDAMAAMMREDEAHRCGR
jgi:hypothetical protein